MFGETRGGYTMFMRTEKQEIALLRILVACGEKTIAALEGSDDITDSDLAAELERVVERSRVELAALTQRAALTP